MQEETRVCAVDHYSSSENHHPVDTCSDSSEYPGAAEAVYRWSGSGAGLIMDGAGPELCVRRTRRLERSGGMPLPGNF